jgi:precorrin-6A/cobalt-precorrin-6A reductase
VSPGIRAPRSARGILILGGTAEARLLAEELHAAAVPVTSSLAGRVTRPRLPVGDVRVGGFGGAAGLADWISQRSVAGVVDATHPFAERISESAAQAATVTGVPLLRLERPGWAPGPGDRWLWVDDLPGAAAAVAALGPGRVLLTTGRQGLAAFAHDASNWFLIRCVDPPGGPLPARCEVHLDRGPYTLDGELRLIDGHAIDVLATKDSGGDLTAAKLAAARERELPVVVVRRPPRRAVPSVATVAEASVWARRQAATAAADAGAVPWASAADCAGAVPRGSAADCAGAVPRASAAARAGSGAPGPGSPGTPSSQ